MTLSGPDQSRAPKAYLSIYLSRLGCSLGELQVVWPDTRRDIPSVGAGLAQTQQHSAL